MLSAKTVERPARFDRVDRVKEAVGQAVLAGDDRFWILGDPLIVQVEGGERIEVPSDSPPTGHRFQGGPRR